MADVPGRSPVHPCFRSPRRREACTPTAAAPPSPAAGAARKPPLATGCRLLLRCQVGSVSEQGLGLLDSVDADFEGLGCLIGGEKGTVRPIFRGTAARGIDGASRHKGPLCRGQVTALDIEADDERQGGGVVAFAAANPLDAGPAAMRDS